ncbi:hypothetical protein XENOCAPTIV_028124, partial [Xenoophorus captivus]
NEKMEEESYSNGSYAGEYKSCLLEGRYLVSLSLINVFTFVIGQPVTAKLLWITYTTKKSTDILNCNLALFHNFLYLVCVLHLIFLFIYQKHQVDLLNIVLIYGQVGGSMNLCFICMERYVAVIYPTSYPLLKKYRWREICTVMVWLSSLSTAMMTTIATGNTCPLKKMVIKNIPFTVMLLATSLMVWCTVRITRALMKSSPGRDQLHPIKRKAFRIVCATTAMNLLCYIPVSVMQMFRIQDEYLFNCTLMPISILVLSAASVVHPLFYLYTKGKLFICLKGQKKAT